MSLTRRIGVLFILFRLAGSPLISQVSFGDTENVRDVIRQAEVWMKIGSYHVARIELDKALRAVTAASDRKELLFLLMTAEFESQEYEQSYYHSTEFLNANQNDIRRNDALYIQGVSAVQAKRYETALRSLNEFLSKSQSPAARAKASYWRGMCKLQTGDQQSAESDLRSCLQDSAARDYHDEALMGLALLSERQGRTEQESDYLEQLIAGYPRSNLSVDARIRSASLSIRNGNPGHAIQVLKEIRPSFRSQREEILFLRAEAEFRSGLYDVAAADYREFLKEFSESPSFRAARFGYAWSHLKRGDGPRAQEEFALLRAGNDTLASASIYQLGILTLLQGKTNEALNWFDTLVTRFPYDRYADQSFYQTGMIHYRNQRYREARRCFQSVVQLYPESDQLADAYHMMGECSVALGDFSNAQYAFAQVRHLNPPADIRSISLLQEGIALYHLGRFKSSASLFDQFINTFPQHSRIVEAYLWNGEALFQDDRFDEAERAYRTSVRLLPNNPKRADAEYGIAWSLFEQKKFRDAAEAFDQFTQHYPESERASDASLRKADCYFFLGQYDKASAMYANLSSSSKNSRHTEYAAFQLAMSYIQRGETERGIDQLRTFLTRFPSSIYNEVVRFNIGWTYFSHEQYQETAIEFQTFLRQYSNSQLMPRVLFNMGDAFYNLKGYDSARVYYQRVIEEYPSSPLAADALTGLQFTYQAEGKSSEALSVIEKFLNAKPGGISQEELLLKKGDILFGQGDFQGAIGEYQHVLSLKPSHAIQAKTLQQLARSYELQNNIERSNSYYKKILDEFSDTEVAPAANLALGIGSIKLTQFNVAVDALKDFEKRFPDSPLQTEASYELGVALMNLPDLESAMNVFQSVIRSHPEQIFADRSRLQIARIHLKQKEYIASIDTVTALIERRGDELAAEGLLVIAENYRAQKRYKDALQAYNDLIQQYKEYPLQIERARFGMGETYELLRDRKQARASYNDILKSPVDPEVRKEVEKRLKKLRP